MWYVIQTLSGKEKVIRQFIENIKDKQAGNIESRLIYYETKRRYCGAWHAEKRLLFPGYIFVYTADLPDLLQQLKNIPLLTKILGSGDDIVPLKDSEVEFLRGLSNNGNMVPMSYGIQIGDQVIIKEGALAGNEYLIRHIDRHKRKAHIEVEMLGQSRLVEVGLEIVEKR